MGFSGGGGGTSPQQSALLNNSSNIMIQNAINILKNNKNDSIADPIYTNIIKDLFSDSNGYNNTIDTGNTTATLSSGTYENPITGTPVTVNGRVTSTAGSDSGTGKYGTKLTTGATNFLTITKLTKHASSTSTKAYILDASKNVLASSSFVGNDATFSYTLSPSTTYYFACDAEGASIVHIKDTGITYPASSTNWDWIADLNNGSDGSSLCHDFFANAVTYIVNASRANGTVQTNMQTLSFTPSYFMIYCDKTLAGSGSLDCDISFNNGSNYQTAVALNTITSITNQGTQMILKLNLKGTGLSNLASASDYGVIFF